MRTYTPSPARSPVSGTSSTPPTWFSDVSPRMWPASSGQAHKATFAPHVDTGDFVVVINADKVALTGARPRIEGLPSQRIPGGLTATTYAELLETNPERAIEKAVAGMLPHNTLGRAQLRKLKVYAGSEHPHAAQQPKPFVIGQVAQ